MMHEFGDMVAKIERGILGLKLTASEAGEDLQQQIDRASTLRDELHFMSEMADGMANRMSTKSKPSIRPQAPERATSSAMAAAKIDTLHDDDEDTAQSGRSRAEQELLQIIKGLRKGKA